MKTRLLTASLFGILLTGCTVFHPHSVWNPATARSDAERDFAADKVRFCYVGGFVPSAPGLPEDANTAISRYPSIAVGPQGCVQSGDVKGRTEYASRYNAQMWKFLTTSLHSTP